MKWQTVKFCYSLGTRLSKTRLQVKEGGASLHKTIRELSKVKRGNLERKLNVVPAAPESFVRSPKQYLCGRPVVPPGE